MVKTTVLYRIGSRRTCETIWIPPENGIRVEILSHGVFIWLLLIGLYVVTVEVQNLGVLQSDHFPHRYETGFTRR